MNQKNVKFVGVGVLDDPKNQKGITLIALVITIIVLLILAGVTISMVLGDDGIIAQAQQAKQAQEDAEEKEQEEIQKGQGNIDLYTTGTVANKVQVGDYVEYNYTAGTVEITAEESGLKELSESWDDSSLAVSQKYSSSIATDAADGTKAAQVTKWRVLSKKDGIVKLVAETPVSSLTLAAGAGWVNAEDTLNDMCKDLYSSSIGTARSINVEDVNEVTGYKIPEKLTEAAYDANYEPMEIAYGTTIAEAAKTAGSGGTEYDMANFQSNTPEEGKNIGDYELTYYYYNGATQMGTTATGGTDKYKMLFRKLDDSAYMPTYWLASSCVNADFYDGYARFFVRYVYYGNVNTNYLFDSIGNTDIPACAVRPVVTLKSGLEIAGGTGADSNPWTINVAE